MCRVCDTITDEIEAVATRRDSARSLGMNPGIAASLEVRLSLLGQALYRVQAACGLPESLGDAGQPGEAASASPAA